MMHKAWSSIEEVPYCFLRSSIKFQGHTGKKIANFDPNWVFPDCNSSLSSPMDLKWCTKLALLFFQVIHQKRHTGWKINDLNPIWVRILGRSQLSNPSDLPCSVWYLGQFSISLLKLSQLKVKSLSQLSNLLQTRFLSCVQASDLGEILTWDNT